MQPFRQLAATLVGLIVIASFKAEMQDPGYCKDPSCFRAVDQAWRAIVGIGIVPALVAFVIRLRIQKARDTLWKYFRMGKGRSKKQNDILALTPI